jgi:hypothetical protein
MVLTRWWRVSNRAVRLRVWLIHAEKKETEVQLIRYDEETVSQGQF